MMMGEVVPRAAPLEESPDTPGYSATPWIWTTTPITQLENNIKIAAAGILDEIEDIPPPQRCDWVQKRSDMMAIPAFFKHKYPTPANMAAAVDRNAHTGKGQPNGTLRLEQYRLNGWWGACLRGNQDLLAHPLTESQIFRFYLMCKIHVDAALWSIGKSGASDAQMLEV